MSEGPVYVFDRREFEIRNQAAAPATRQYTIYTYTYHVIFDERAPAQISKGNAKPGGRAPTRQSNETGAKQVL